MFFLIVIPQLRHEFRRHQSVRVLRQQPNDEDAVGFQVMVNKHREELPMFGSVVAVHELQMFLDIQNPVDCENEFERPFYEINTRADSDYNEPPPDKEKNHLIEQIHR